MPARRSNSFPLVAVDIGNSRVKLGLFDSRPAPGVMPVPARTLFVGPGLSHPELETWLSGSYTSHPWLISSVQRKTAANLANLLRQRGVHGLNFLQASDLPITTDLLKPEQVGIDRLVNAVAANAFKEPGRAAIVISVGTAITVNAISEQGVFLGGAILPGIGMAARALHEFTDLLPQSEMTELHSPPDALGKDTTSALQSGLYWGAVGAMKELTSRLSEQLGSPQLFLTGGAAPSVSQYLVDSTGKPALFEPHLTLAGIAIAAAS
jgi:type III pantothenate kinase